MNRDRVPQQSRMETKVSFLFEVLVLPVPWYPKLKETFLLALLASIPLAPQVAGMTILWKKRWNWDFFHNFLIWFMLGRLVRTSFQLLFWFHTFINSLFFHCQLVHRTFFIFSFSPFHMIARKKKLSSLLFFPFFSPFFPPSLSRFFDGFFFT